MINKSKGFTLLEVVAVIVILAIIGTVSFAVYTNFFKESDLASRQLQAKSITDVVSEYIHMNNGQAPTVDSNADYLDKPAILDKGKIKDSLNDKIEGNYYIYGINNEVFYDYPTNYIAKVYQDYQTAKGTAPIINGTNYIDVNLLFTSGYLQNPPQTSYTITPEGKIEQIPLKQDISPGNANGGSDKPTIPVIIPSKADPYYVNDKIYFTANSYYEKGEVTYIWTIDGVTLGLGEDINKKTNGKFTKGNHIIKVKAVSDDGKYSEEATFNLIVNAENQPPTKPVITVNPSKPTYLSNDIIKFTAVSTDPENEAITYKWFGITSNDKYKRGDNVITVYAVDINGNTSEKASVTIKVLNSPPIIKSVINSKNPIYIDTVLDFTPIIEDPDNDLTEYEITSGLTNTKTYPLGTNKITIVAKDTLGAVSDVYTHTFVVVNRPPTKPTLTMNPSTGLRPDTNITFTASGSTDPENHSITYEWNNKLTNYPFGTHTVKVRAVDQLNAASDWASITFTISNSPPSVPTLTMSPAPNSDIRANTPITFTASGSVDPEGDTFTYEFENKQSTYPVGTHVVRARAVDKFGSASGWASITFTVNNTAPTAPTINMTPSTGIKANTTITWSATGSVDIDGDAITYEWINQKSTYPKGTHTVQARAKDSRGAYSTYTSKTFTVENTPPVLNSFSSNKGTYTVGETITYSYNATDLDGDPLTYEFGNGMTTATTPGTHTITLRAKDSSGEYSNTRSITITITNQAPSKPTIVVNPSGKKYGNTPLYISATGSVDPDGHTVTYVWRKGQAMNGGTLTPGIYEFEVVARDQYGAESPVAAAVVQVVDQNGSGAGGLLLTGPDSRIYYPENGNLPTGATFTKYSFNVPSVDGHSGSDYAYVNGLTTFGTWEQLRYSSTSNGINFPETNITPGRYIRLEYFYYASHCMYGKSNITYSMEYEYN